MIDFFERVRRFTSIGVVLIVPALAVALPLMERLDRSPHPVIETEHSPESCPPSHDHAICVQAGALALLGRRPVRVDEGRVVPDMRGFEGGRDLATRSAVASHGARAPPLA